MLISQVIRTFSLIKSTWTYYSQKNLLHKRLHYISLSIISDLSHENWTWPGLQWTPPPPIPCVSHTVHHPLLVGTVLLHYSLGLWTVYQRVLGFRLSYRATVKVLCIAIHVNMKFRQLIDEDQTTLVAAECFSISYGHLAHCRRCFGFIWAFFRSVCAATLLCAAMPLKKDLSEPKCWRRCARCPY